MVPPKISTAVFQYLIARNVSSLTQQNERKQKTFVLLCFSYFLAFRVFLNFRGTCTRFMKVCTLKAYKKNTSN